MKFETKYKAWLLVIAAALWILISCVSILTIKDSDGSQIDYNSKKAGIATKLDSKVDSKIDSQISQEVESQIEKSEGKVIEQIQAEVKTEVKESRQVQDSLIIFVVDSIRAYKKNK